MLHFAYVSAVVADAGHVCEFVSNDRGIDCRVIDWRHNEQRGYYDAGVAFNCQLKSSRSPNRRKFSNGQLLYKMKQQAYNKLVDWDGHQFAILVVFRMPDVEEKWFSQTEDILSLKHCCYWTELSGGPIDESEKEIEIDRSKVFDKQAVIELVKRARQGKKS